MHSGPRRDLDLSRTYQAAFDCRGFPFSDYFDFLVSVPTLPGTGGNRIAVCQCGRRVLMQTIT
ncbi:hypothetical protein EXIGLDRAFT_720699, partial [Exidia glandulosa HHB12029]